MDMFNITNQMTYNPKKSQVEYENIQIPIYAHPQELLNIHGQKTWEIFNELIDENILSSFFNFFSKNNLLNISFEDFKNIIE